MAKEFYKDKSTTATEQPSRQESVCTGHGGRRPGAGRPRTSSKLYTFRAPKAIADVLDQQKSKSDFIKDCIANTMTSAEKTNMATNDVLKPDFSRLGTVIPATHVHDMKLPYFDIGIVAGFPIPLDNDEKAQDIDILKMLCPYPESSYLIRIEGNSMIDAGIYSGDIVIVDKSNRNPSETEVAVCELNGEYTLKRFVKRNGTGWLIPANQNYPEIKVTEDDDFSIWGTVTYIIHKPRK